MKLIKTNVEALPYTEKGQVFYWDDELQGFGVYVGTKSKTFCVQQRIGRKTRRVVLGKYPTLTAEQARAAAKKEIGKLAQGIDPNQAKREERVKHVTLGVVFDEFLSTRQLKPKTIMDYKGVMANLYSDWLKKPITDITGDAVEARHAKISTERGKAYANLGGRTLRSVLNYAAAKHKILPVNPVTQLSQTRSWFKVAKRTGHIKNHQFKAWFDAVSSLESPVIKDYLIFVMLTGTRKNEAASLLWSDVDLVDRSYFIRSPKNSNPLQLPLSDYLVDMLTARKIASKTAFVFPGDSASGHLVEPKKQVQKVIDKSGVEFTLHDLRRTFATTAESLDIAPYTLKALVNHSQEKNEVTGGYIQITVERLRKPMQAITDFILKSAGVRSAGIVDFNQAAVSRESKAL